MERNLLLVNEGWHNFLEKFPPKAEYKKEQSNLQINNENLDPNVRGQQFNDFNSRKAHSLMVQNEIYTQYYSNRDHEEKEIAGFSQLSWRSSSKFKSYRQKSLHKIRFFNYLLIFGILVVILHGICSKKIVYFIVNFHSKFYNFL